MDARTAIIEHAPTPSVRPVGQATSWHDGLSEKERAFVEHYAQDRNATQAYTHAYDTNGAYETRRNEGARLLLKPHVQEAIKARQRIATEASGADVAWLLNRFIRIATADPRELIGLKVGCCRHCYGDGNGYQWREREYLEALDEAERQQREGVKGVRYPDPGGGFGFNATHPPHPSCPQCHGEGLERFVPRDTDRLSDQALLLYGGVKVKKDGYEIIIADQQKAAELAGRIMGAFTDKVKISGVVGHMVAMRDIKSLDPQDASKAYRDFIAGNLAVGD